MAKTAAKGTIFKVGTKPVGALTSIGGVSASADTIDVTALDNEDGYKEFIGGFKDGGDVSLSGHFDYEDEGQKALYAAFESGTVSECEIVFPAAMACKWTFSGVVTAIETSAELDGAVSFSCTVKVSGKPSLVANPSV